MRYLQLVHNVWDPAAKTAKAQVIHSFGREDQLDREAIARLVASLTKLLDPVTALAGAGAAPGLEFCSSRALGATWALEGLWRRLGLDAVFTELLAGTRRPARTERVLFGLVAARAIEPASKLATAAWLPRRTWITGLTDTPTPAVGHDAAEPEDPGAAVGETDIGAVSEDECYRAMDWLIECAEEVEKRVFWSVATLLDLEVDLLFFDTTSTYFETEDADDPVDRDHRGMPQADAGAATAVPTEPGADTKDGDGNGDGEGTDGTDARRAGFRTFGKSKDSRGDLPQIVIGMAVTRTGIPVRVWSWPGNTADSALIRQAKADLREWTLSRIVWVGDRGFTSKANRRDLRAGGHTYILGEKLRGTDPDAAAALARQGRYSTVAGNLQVKEVKVREDERFVVCFNPEAADRDAAIRQLLVDKLTALIDGSDKLPAGKRSELVGKISTMPGLNRYLRRTPGGLLRIDRAKVAAEARLDGKYLLRCSDPTLSAADIALGYKQLIMVERGWRELKTSLELRPVYHRLEHRIRAHVLLCWLSLLLIRIIENATDTTWARTREDLQDLHVGVFTGPAGTFAQTTTLTAAQKTIFDALEVTPPRKILQITPAPAEDTPTEDTAAPIVDDAAEAAPVTA